MNYGKCAIKKEAVQSSAVETANFNRGIPSSVQDEIEYVNKLTKKTGAEQSLTFCRLKGRNKIFVSNYAKGDNDATYVMPCHSAHGHAEKIGDMHTHPTQDPMTVGITPSVADFVSTLIESYNTKIPQISCISGPDAKHIHCYQPKKEILDDQEKLKMYKRALAYRERNVTDVHPYFREHVGDDFNHAWYDRKKSNRISQPKPKEIVNDSFLTSRDYLKFKDIPDLEKGAFCDLVEDMSLPNNDNVGQECRKVLKVKEFLGFEY